jgi:hypothetical protein
MEETVVYKVKDVGPLKWRRNSMLIRTSSRHSSPLLVGLFVYRPCLSNATPDHGVALYRIDVTRHLAWASRCDLPAGNANCMPIAIWRLSLESFTVAHRSCSVLTVIPPAAPASDQSTLPAVQGERMLLGPIEVRTPQPVAAPTGRTDSLRRASIAAVLTPRPRLSAQ